MSISMTGNVSRSGDQIPFAFLDIVGIEVVEVDLVGVAAKDVHLAVMKNARRVTSSGGFDCIRNNYSLPRVFVGLRVIVIVQIYQNRKGN